MKRIASGLVGAAAFACVGLLSVPVLPAKAMAQGSSSCERCGPRVSTSYRYRTVQRVTNSTRYRDVTRTHVRRNIHRVVTVTRIQPIHRVNVVTRVHNRTVMRNETQHLAQTRMLPARTITTAKTVQIGSPGCRC